MERPQTPTERPRDRTVPLLHIRGRCSVNGIMSSFGEMERWNSGTHSRSSATNGASEAVRPFYIKFIDMERWNTESVFQTPIPTGSIVIP